MVFSVLMKYLVSPLFAEKRNLKRNHYLHAARNVMIECADPVGEI